MIIVVTIIEFLSGAISRGASLTVRTMVRNTIRVSLALVPQLPLKHRAGIRRLGNKQHSDKQKHRQP